jgi:hypothetical protein
VEQINPQTGNDIVFIPGLRTAIGVLPVSNRGHTEYLVLQHTSGNVILPPFSGPGLLLRFATPDGQPTVLANCLTRPTSMTLNRKTNTLYVSELSGPYCGHSCCSLKRARSLPAKSRTSQ